jgi:Protein of unknown function (DUF664)/SET domain
MDPRTEPVRIWIDARLELRPSPIHGIGNFAAAPIRAGETLTETHGGIVVTQQDRDTGRSPVAEEIYSEERLAPDLFLIWPKCSDYYFNHSCEPNVHEDAETRRQIAMRDVPEGAELTIDYLYTPDRWPNEPCRCGSATCRNPPADVDDKAEPDNGVRGTSDVEIDTYPELRADERTTLEQFLDHYRRAVLTRLNGLTDVQAAAQVLPATNLTVGGIVKHLAAMEDLWFRRKMMGSDPVPELWGEPPVQEAWAFSSAAADSVGQIADLYQAACVRSRAAAATFDSLDATAAVPSFGKGPVTLRWIYVHMLDETACHVGHLDVLSDALKAESSG